MSTMDCMIVLGPFLALVGVMMVCFGIAHWCDVRSSS